MSTAKVNICLIEWVEPTWRRFGVVAEKEDLHANNWICSSGWSCRTEMSESHSVLCSRLLLHKLLLESHAHCDISQWLSTSAGVPVTASQPSTLRCQTRLLFSEILWKPHVHPRGRAPTLTCDSVWSTSVSFLAALLPDMNRDGAGCNGLWTMILGYTTIDSLYLDISCSIYPFNTYSCTRVELLEVIAK